MPMVYGQWGPGLPGNPALDALRDPNLLNPTDSGSRGPINPNRLTENGAGAMGAWVYPRQAPPNQLGWDALILESLKTAYPTLPWDTQNEQSIMTKLQGPTALQGTLTGPK